MAWASPTAHVHDVAMLLLLVLVQCPASSSCPGGVDFIFEGFHQPSNLSVDGSALILSSGALQLTNSSNHIMGHAFFHSPIKILQGESESTLEVTHWSTIFVFDIVTSSESGSGHGLAFVIAPSKQLPGAFDQDYLGVLGPTTNGNSSNHVFAVEFDTQSIAALNEPNGSHVGVDINSVVSTVSEPSSYYTDDNKRVAMPLDSGRPIQAWIDYDGTTNVLNVSIAPVPMPQPQRPLISTQVDLVPVFKSNMYVGFSSATGKLASSHYILAWSFRTNNGSAQHIDLSRLPKVPRPSPSPPKSAIIKIAALACASTLLVTAAVWAMILLVRRRAALAETLEDWELEQPHRFSYKDLYRATKGFKKSELVGAGGFGQVYKGVLRRSGDEVAVKRMSSSNTREAMRGFVAEIASLGRMRHRNLVELRGWCRRGQDMFLVYDLMPNGSLDKHLFGDGERSLSTWAERLEIIKGVASGLTYLHEEWDQVVVHRDVKPSNVLLGDGMVARLADFGLARLYDHGSSSGQLATATRVVGTLGYMAPELTASGRPTTSTDVFAFGVLLLEVACGRRPIQRDDTTGLDVTLVRWVRRLALRGDVMLALDPRLHCMRYEEQDQAKLVLWLAMMCSQDKPDARPSMRQVCRYLDGELTVQEDAALIFSNTPDFSMGLGWSSCGTMSFTSLRDGR
ncbi:L-type lectin-domain containing receptor kinase SIT2-like [Oryza brachyantha]|uniref:non-specific serine/threonine protein kinase n=1 Tax=Oryza brachyantha TaxID=4533 RepID=J3NAV5_ORYBR|nr:L-type lectin-domain containing receptor kinase SIT2-like [Oryza brachyantha]